MTLPSSARSSPVVSFSMIHWVNFLNHWVIWFILPLWYFHLCYSYFNTGWLRKCIWQKNMTLTLTAHRFGKNQLKFIFKASRVPFSVRMTKIYRLGKQFVMINSNIQSKLLSGNKIFENIPGTYYRQNNLLASPSMGFRIGWWCSSNSGHLTSIIYSFIVNPNTGWLYLFTILFAFKS